MFNIVIRSKNNKKSIVIIFRPRNICSKSRQFFGRFKLVKVSKSQLLIQYIDLKFFTNTTFVNN